MRAGPFALLLFATVPAPAQVWSTFVGGGIGFAGPRYEGTHLTGKKYGGAFIISLREELTVSDHIRCDIGMRFEQAKSSVVGPDGRIWLEFSGSGYRYHFLTRSIDLPIGIDLCTSTTPVRGVHFRGGWAPTLALEAPYTIDTIEWHEGVERTASKVRGSYHPRTRGGSWMGGRTFLGLAKEFRFGDRRLRICIDWTWDHSALIYPTFDDPLNTEMGVVRRRLMCGVEMQL